MMFCDVFFWKFGLPIGLHSSCSISPTSSGTCQKCSTKYHDCSVQLEVLITYLASSRSLYQIDRTACSEVDERTGSDVEVWHRLQWVADARAGKLEHIAAAELEKYLVRGETLGS